jgi:hypothetical protein
VWQQLLDEQQTQTRMADSDLSASELRQRYHKGGTAGDDELTASQLRARHGVASNTKGLSVDALPLQFLLIC